MVHFFYISNDFWWTFEGIVATTKGEHGKGQIMGCCKVNKSIFGKVDVKILMVALYLCSEHYLWSWGESL